MQEGDRATRVLVTGARGQLGSRLVEFGTRRRTLHVKGLDQTDLDITNPTSIQEALSHHAPDVVINGAAYTAVDLAEREPERAFDINGQGVKHLAEACSQHGVALIHVSTDYVFGEVDRVPLGPSEPTGPLGVYGASKLEGEEAFLASGVHGAVVRVAWLYDARGSNFLTTMLQLAHQHGRLKVVHDQHGVPTSAPALAEALLDMAERGRNMPQGIRHFAHAGHTTWHGFASAIVGHAGLDVPVEAVTSDAFPTAATRPTWSVLDGAPLHQEMGWTFEPWQNALAACWELREEG
ncbi:MAG: dTDP-4-dehydrorhamnose reductase [Flavobacteriales bacterium]